MSDILLDISRVSVIKLQDALVLIAIGTLLYARITHVLKYV